MKFAAAYYLLLIYTMVIIKTLIPAVEDMLVHSFAEARHLSTIHTTEGSDHVEKEIAADADTDSNKHQKADKAEQTIHETAFDHIFNCLNPYPFTHNYPFTRESLSNIFIAYVNPPPRIVI